MSGSGTPNLNIDGAGLRVAIVAASWHEDVMNGLIAGAQRASDACGAESQLFRVPGSFELPIAAKRAAESGFVAVVALGVIIRGGTPHFDYVSTGVTDGLTQVSLATGVPVGFGILTCDDDAQALDRAGLPGSSEDKGAEAFDAAVATVTVLKEIGSGRQPYPGFTPV